MKSSIKISLAVAAGAVGTLAGVGVGAVSDWRLFADSAKKQALERRINDLESKIDKKDPKVQLIGAGGGAGDGE